MKRLLGILAIVLLIGAIAYPVLAHGPKWGKGGHMMYGWEGGPDTGPSYGRGYDKLTAEQREELDALHKKFYDETTSLRNELRNKSTELDTILNTANPDTEKAKTLQKEISDLQAELSQKQIDLELEKRKINPDARYGRGYGRGYGRHMMGYGPHMRGYGPGACWR